MSGALAWAGRAVATAFKLVFMLALMLIMWDGVAVAPIPVLAIRLVRELFQ